MSSCLKSSNSSKEVVVSNQLNINSWDWLKLKNKYKHLCTYEGCNRRFEAPTHLQIHIRRVHTFEKPFQCDECKEAFFSKPELKRHQMIHLCQRNPDLRLKCDFKDCNKYFYHDSILRKHKRDSHSVERWVCDWPECGQTYKYIYDLNVHKRWHLGIKQYKCRYNGCNKAFVKNIYLERHEKTHSKTFVCLWPGCEERFSLKDSLTSHMNKHQNLKPFKCSFDGCGQAFYGKPQLFHHNWSLHRKK